LFLQFGKLPAFPSMVREFVVWENSSWHNVGTHWINQFYA